MSGKNYIGKDGWYNLGQDIADKYGRADNQGTSINTADGGLNDPSIGTGIANKETNNSGIRIADINADRRVDNSGIGINTVNIDGGADDLGKNMGIANIDGRENDLIIGINVVDRRLDNPGIGIGIADGGVDNLNTGTSKANRRMDNLKKIIVDIDEDRRVDNSSIKTTDTDRADNLGIDIDGRGDKQVAISNKT